MGSETICALLWKVSRKHGWSSPISEDGLTDLALEDADQGKGREVVQRLTSEPYITYQRGQGYGMKNDPDSQAQAAYRLKNVCGYTELQIEATLSRFQEAGGFDAYEKQEVMKTLDDWD